MAGSGQLSSASLSAAAQPSGVYVSSTAAGHFISGGARAEHDRPNDTVALNERVTAHDAGLHCHSRIRTVIT